MTPRSPALSDVLFMSSRCLADVSKGHSLTEALASVPAPLRAAVQAISWYGMRHWGLAIAWAETAFNRKPTSQWLECHVALSLLLLDAAMIEHGQAPPDSFQAPLDQSCPSYTPHTLVDQSVKAVRLAKLGKPSVGLVNAVLRRFQRERAMFVEATRRNLVAQWNHPIWWIKKLRTAYPSCWQQILQTSQTRPKLVLRVNLRRASVEQVLMQLRTQGHACYALGQHAVVLEQSAVIETLYGFHEGWWSVQDWSAQQAAPLLNLTDGQRVLDACAAPGGKTAHMLECADIYVTALDQDASRLNRVRENLERLKLLSNKVTLKVADARQLDLWWDGQLFDVILADVPCTASGVVRRHPDIAWLRRESDLAQTVALQVEILDALWPTLAPNGLLLLVTCSVFPEEGENQAKALLNRHPDAVRLDAPGQCLPMTAGLDSRSGQDGFFYALFQRRPQAQSVIAI
jgi:16S rRNA (cytosine967-C5)-methyltransferase